MADHPTVHLQHCLERLQAGDASARDDLIHHACGRLQRLTRKMLKDYGGVQRWEETSDVFQNAMIRLCRALKEVSPGTLLDFYRLAALQVRRELIDLARHHSGPMGMGANHASVGPAPAGDSGSLPPAYEAADRSGEPGELAVWTEFHRQVELLPDEEREVFDLLWYQGLSQAEAAAMVGVSDRTIKNRWRAARVKLHAALAGGLPTE